MRIIFIILGFICTGLGALGVVLPVIPTTPFLLLASFCFTKGSKKFHNWFLGTKLYKNHLEDFVKSRAMTLKTKVMILSFASTMLLIAFFITDIVAVRVIISFMFVFMYYYFIFRIKTVKVEEVQE